MRTFGLATNIAFNFYSWFNMFMPRKTSIFVMIHKMAVKSICDDYLFEHSAELTAHCDCRCQCQLSRSERMKRQKFEHIFQHLGMRQLMDSFNVQLFVYNEHAHCIYRFNLISQILNESIYVIVNDIGIKSRLMNNL